MDQATVDQGMGGEAMAPEETPAEQGETIVVQIVCQHAPDGTKTYLVGRASEGGEADLQPAGTLDEALRAAKMLLGGDEAAQAESEFQQGFRGSNAAPY